MRPLLRSSVLCVSLVAVGCAGGSTGGTAPESSATVRIENRSGSDVDIYLRPALSRPTRVGFVPAAETVEFSLPRALFAGASSFHLEARPIRGGSASLSEPFTARAGEEIFWSIPP
jgi:hypothetical protein